MLQLLYISSAVGTVDNAPILIRSRRNNVRADVTGLLYADGVRFLQVLEGPDEAVEATFARISDDPRHRAIVVLSRRTVDRREFGPWDMAYRAAGDADDALFLQRIERLLAETSPNVRGTFAGFMQVRRAA